MFLPALVPIATGKKRNFITRPLNVAGAGAHVAFYAGRAEFAATPPR